MVTGRIPPLPEVDQPDDQQVYLKHNCLRGTIRKIPGQSSGEGDECDEEQGEGIDPEETPVNGVNIIVLDMVADPEPCQYQERNHIMNEVWYQGDDDLIYEGIIRYRRNTCRQPDPVTRRVIAKA
jgi:hypothetical protein